MTEHFGTAPALEVDQRPRLLLEKYTGLIGSVLMDTAEGLAAFEVPPSEQRYWGEARQVRVALLPEALEEDPEAEVLAVGSPLFERLLTAIRARGFREARGVIPPTTDPSPDAASVPVPVESALVEQGTTELTLVPVGRLLARVSIRAGTRIEERLIETLPVDFSTGAPLPIELIASLEMAPAPRSRAHHHPDAKVLAVRPAAELLPLLFGLLEQQLAPELARAREEAARSLGAELHRLERYYQAMLDDVEPDDDDPNAARAHKAAIEGERKRRTEEEEERSRLRVTVHPLQITEWQVLAQRAVWTLTTPEGRTAELAATRLLTGVIDWRVSCPGCGSVPTTARVCRHGHVACPACSEVCGVCGQTECRAHGLATCQSEGHPVCATDARTCTSCGAAHCAAHAAPCRPGDHEACLSCALHCARCGLEVCKAHATHTGQQAPRGARWLCGSCVVLCEGGSNEPIGLDEAVRCSSCERHICEVHRVNCAVDGLPHCSRHLRRSDRSGRLSCEQHRAVCADEASSSLASDEVFACVQCGRHICEIHGSRCDTDQAIHCSAHLLPLADKPGAKACESHRSVCFVDQVTFSLAGTQRCPVCGRNACLSHRVACSYCARQVCVRDVEEGRCTTCRILAETADPADELLQAALAANGGQPVHNKGWRTARDASHTVAELDLGWTRRLVFTVSHGDTKPRTVVRHSLLGSRRKR